MSLSRFILPILVLLLMLSTFFVFTVDQREYAMVFRLGKIQKSDFEPGLHFKLPPPIDTVRKFDRRLLGVEAEGARFLTKEQKDVIVDSFAKWRIADMDAYYKATGGSERKAAVLISQKINASLRDEIAKRDMHEVIAGERGQLMKIVTDEAKQQGLELGINVVDVRVKKINFPEEVSSSVYARMSSNRERYAKKLRSEGAQNSEQIKSKADQERTVILAEAFREAEKIKGQGDAQAAEIYSNVYGKNPEFYAFYRSLSAYRESFGKHNDILVLDPDSQFFNYFQSPNAK